MGNFQTAAKMASAALPPLPAVITATIQMRSFDGKTFKLRLSNVEEATDSNIELLCADGWGDGVRTLPPKQPLALRGARAERDESHLPPWRLVLDAAAAADALVSMEFEGKRVEVRRNAVSAIDLFDGGAAAGGSAIGAPPRYEYTRVAELGVRMQMPNGKEKTERNVYGVVAEYSLPARTSGRDAMSTMLIVDESCATAAEGLQLNLFKGHAYVPHVGAVVRVHRAMMQRRPQDDANVRKGFFATNTAAAKGSNSTTTAVVCLALDDRADSLPGARAFVVGEPGAEPEARTQVGEYDTARVRELQRWARALLSDAARVPAFFTASRKFLSRFDQLRWPAEDAADAFADVVCRVDWLSSHEPLAHPPAQPFARLCDGTRAALDGAAGGSGGGGSGGFAFESIELFADKPALAAVLGAHAMVHAKVVVVLAQLQRAHAAAAEAGVELWVRLRSVRVLAASGPPLRPVVQLTPNSKLSCMPDFHLDMIEGRARLAALAAAAPQSAPPPPPRGGVGQGGGWRQDGDAGHGVISAQSPTWHEHTDLPPTRSLRALLDAPAGPQRWRVQAQVAAVLPDAPDQIARPLCAGCVRGRGDVRWEYRAVLVLEDASSLLNALVTGEQACALFAPPAAADGGVDGVAEPCTQAIAARVAALKRADSVADVCVQSYQKRQRQSGPVGADGQRLGRARAFQLFDTIFASERRPPVGFIATDP
jgi:hypothetical protein